MEQHENKIQRLRERHMQNKYYKNTSEECLLNEVSMENLKTPVKRTLRERINFQSEPKSRKTRNKKIIEIDVKRNTEQKEGILKKNSKLWQSCFVNIETLTPNKLNMVKTINSPLLQVKNALANRQTKQPKYNVVYNDDYVVDYDFSVKYKKVDEKKTMIKCDNINRTKKNEEHSFTEESLTNDNTYVEENTLNNTFTFLPDESRSDQKLKEYKIDYIQNNQLNDGMSKYSSVADNVITEIDKSNFIKNCSSFHNESIKNSLRKKGQSVFEIRKYDKENNDDLKEETYNAKEFIKGDHKCENLKQNDDEALDGNFTDFSGIYTSINTSNNSEVAAKSFNNITIRKHLIKSSDVDINDTSSKDREKFKNNELTNIDYDMLDDDLNNFNSTITLNGNKNISNLDEHKPIITNDGDNSYEIPVGVSQDINKTPLQTSITNFHGVLDTRNINLENSVKQKKSIAKRLSKVMESTKPQRVANSSRISKDSRLSSVNLSRISKLSGTKAVQLYEFLTDKQSDDICTNDLPAIRENINLVESPPHSSSTPKIVKQHVISSLLKKTSKKDKNNVTFNDTINISDNVFSKKISRGKMPNFALIHKKHFDKMENISDYKDRKNERAKLLLSGSKPVIDNSKTQISSNKKITKDLVQAFNETKSNVSFNTKARHSINDISLLTSTPPFTQTHAESFTPKNCIRDSFIDKSLKSKMCGSKKVKINISPYKSFDENKVNIVMRKTPYKETSNSNKHTKSKTPLQVNTASNCTINSKGSLTDLPFIKEDTLSIKKQQFSTNNKINLSRNVPVTKPLLGKQCDASNSVKQGLTASKSENSKTGYTRFGFRVPVKPKKQDIIKAVVNKSRIRKNDILEEKRTIIKGVRSNRRFDLLMSMRQKK